LKKDINKFMSIFGKKNDDKNDNNKEEIKKSSKFKVEKNTKKEISTEEGEAKKSMKDLYEEGSNKTVKSGEIIRNKKGNAYKILIKPLITEKATILAGHNKYVFAVNLNANKIEIANAIVDIYGIKPININIIKIEGKEKRTGRVTGKRKDWKKAIITLPEGKTIQVYEGV